MKTVMDEEIWKPISGYEGYYDVSSYGNIRSLDRLVPHARGVRSLKGGPKKMHVGSHGYFFVNLVRNGLQEVKLVHRIVAKEFIPNPDALATVDHRDFDRLNNNALNLEWVSLVENNKRMWRAGRGSAGIGERNWKAILTEENVREIRNRKDESRVSVAMEFGVDSRTISSIIHGHTWKCVA